MRGDLFSLGLVALQMYHYKTDVSGIYKNPDPRFRNYRMDIEELNRLI